MIGIKTPIIPKIFPKINYELILEFDAVNWYLANELNMFLVYIKWRHVKFSLYLIFIIFLVSIKLLYTIFCSLLLKQRVRLSDFFSSIFI
jgi:hypothetical protein